MVYHRIVLLHGAPYQVSFTSVMKLQLVLLNGNSGLCNFEIRFGIRISETESCHTILFLEFRESWISDKCRIPKKCVPRRLPERQVKVQRFWQLTALKFDKVSLCG